MKNIAIIPARSGSKGVKDKNIRPLYGKPLLAYSIEAALASKQFNTVMVSTDSKEYAEIARKYGAEVPFLRSAETSTDSARTWDVVKEVLHQYEDAGRHFDTVCVLQPTSPLRRERDIRKAYDLFIDRASVAVVSVCKAEHSPVWCGKLDQTRSIKNFIPPERVGNRQEMGDYYRLNGALYIWDVKALYKNDYIFREGSYAFVMEENVSIDIDTEMDFRMAEFILREVLSPVLNVEENRYHNNLF